MPTPKVIDLSHHNVIPASLQGAYDAGIRGIVHKATEGAGYKDPKCLARFHLARAANMLWGVYHFLQPGSPIVQAKHFLKTVAAFHDEKTLYVCDFEVAGIPLTDVLAFMQYVEGATGGIPVLYSGNTLKEAALTSVAGQLLQNYPLWLAQYSNTYRMPNGWGAGPPWLWQYTDGGKIVGVSSPVDLNSFGGTDVQLVDEWPMPALTNDPVIVPPDAAGTYGIALAVPAGMPVQLYVNGELKYQGNAP